MQKLATAPTVLQKLQAKKNKKGFTLVELVIVIAILAILASIAIPVVISTINSANVSTFTSDTATMEMLLKAAINEHYIYRRNERSNNRRGCICHNCTDRPYKRVSYRKPDKRN